MSSNTDGFFDSENIQQQLDKYGLDATVHVGTTGLSDRIDVTVRINGEKEKFSYGSSYSEHEWAQRIINDIKAEFSEQLTFDDRRMKIDMCNQMEVTCLSCGSSTSFSELLSDSRFNRLGESSEPQPMGYDVPELLAKLSDDEMLSLKLLLIGVLEERCWRTDCFTLDDQKI
jgi:hypothetical protein